VVGLHGAEDSLDHGGLEVGRWLHGRELAGEILPDTEVFCAPDDLLREFGETGGDTAYGQGLLAGVDVCNQMDFNAAGEVEAAFDGCFDNGDFLQVDHRLRASSCVRVNVAGLIPGKAFVYEDESMKTNEMSFVKTGDARTFAPEHGMRRQVLAHSDQLMLVRHFFEQGWVGARHSHPHHQLVYVVSGAIRVDVDGRVFDVRAGDSFVVDGGVEHQASALEASEVLDVFTPVREDYRELVK
jgi:quercetin dioxygenase-like cupin family protein